MSAFTPRGTPRLVPIPRNKGFPTHPAASRDQRKPGKAYHQDAQILKLKTPVMRYGGEAVVRRTNRRGVVNERVIQ